MAEALVVSFEEENVLCVEWAASFGVESVLSIAQDVSEDASFVVANASFVVSNDLDEEYFADEGVVDVDVDVDVVAVARSST